MQHKGWCMGTCTSMVYIQFLTSSIPLQIRSPPIFTVSVYPTEICLSGLHCWHYYYYKWSSKTTTSSGNGVVGTRHGCSPGRDITTAMGVTITVEIGGSCPYSLLLVSWIWYMFGKYCQTTCLLVNLHACKECDHLKLTTHTDLLLISAVLSLV